MNISNQRNLNQHSLKNELHITMKILL